MKKHIAFLAKINDVKPAESGIIFLDIQSVGLGAPIPEWLKKTLAQYKDKIDQDKDPKPPDTAGNPE